MTKKIGLSILAILFLLSACSSTQDKMQSVLNAKWQTYSQGKNNFTGGIGMQIISPKGTFFISTDMGSDASDKMHFRAASCTKTFTAAAIMSVSYTHLTLPTIYSV